MNNKEWAGALTDAFNRDRPKGHRTRPIKLPSGLRFSGTIDGATIEIGKSAIEANMQSDAAAFDGWAFALMRWLDVRKIRLTVPEGTHAERGHFERFAFRLDRFCALADGKVEVDAALAQVVKPARFRSGSPLLNIARSSHGYDGIPTAQRSESELEILLCHNPVSRAMLMESFDLKHLCRQFPVGLFQEKVAAANRIFPGGKSAIDLIGVDRERAVHIFELKKAKNAKVGALSELIFYLAVLEEARVGRWVFDDPRKLDPKADVSPEQVRAAPCIKGHLLAPNFHPLIDDRLLQAISAAMTSAGWGTSIDCHDLKSFLPEPDAAA